MRYHLISEYSESKVGSETHKYPRERMAMSEIFVRKLTCSFHTIGIGRDANNTSVMILTTVTVSSHPFAS